MSNLAESILPREDAYLEGGRVVGTAQDRLIVQAGQRRVDARPAAACLIAPAVGDQVLLATVGRDVYVLSVLERDDAQPARVNLEGGLEMRITQGRFKVAAQDGVDLATAGDTTMTTRELKLTAVEGSVLVNRLKVLGERIDGEINKLHVVAETVDTIAERMRHKLQRCYRFVAQVDQLRSGSIDHKAESFARLHAGDTVVTADKLVKVDGQQIHVG